MIRNVVKIMYECGKDISLSPHFLFFTANGANPSTLEI
jgi:hypothetical protein